MEYLYLFALLQMGAIGFVSRFTQVDCDDKTSPLPAAITTTTPRIKCLFYYGIEFFTVRKLTSAKAEIDYVGAIIDRVIHRKNDGGVRSASFGIKLGLA